ncbi:fimbria/pilus outer membrane usher protein [Acidipila sp. EB88]|uniref:fimbria/pilus outer membrane usher protein n=1 Tax=Acidipila sp. EB88 TaxID=2305226 RepID=UPI000F5DBC72|nr:fimbria/pilus outer membrane usher protein [Acidipila sp. EB88]RRA49551.1 fimbrial biogenesis outer membrane usher protein [Acidipila sp. EB88]
MPVLLLLLRLTTLPALGDEQALLLDVHVNGHAVGKIGEFVYRNGVLLATRAELEDLGIRGPLGLVRRGPGAAAMGDGLIDLATLPGLTWHLDEQTQTIEVTATNERLMPAILAPDEAPGVAPPNPHATQSGTGVTLNYDIVNEQIGRQTAQSGSIDMRGFSPRGVVESTFLAYSGAPQVSLAAPAGTGSRMLTRLDTSYTLADVKSLRRYNLGDFITGGLSWTRPVRLGGLQVKSDFSMRPDLITFPLPTVAGSAAVPSTVNILADGNLVSSHQVDAGVFEVPQLPVINGANTITMTVTNALGQQVNITQDFYTSATLLAPGLQTFSAQVGAFRQNWGVISNQYGKTTGVVDYRRGLSSSMTLEASAEGAPGTLMAGAGAVLKIDHYGVVNISAAGSDGARSNGRQLSVGAQRVGTRLSLGASATFASRGFTDVAAVNGEPVPRRQISANGDVMLRHLGSVGIAYAGIDQDASLYSVNGFLAPSQRNHTLYGSYSLQVGRATLYANEFMSLTDSNSNGLQAGLTIPLGRRSILGVSAGTTAGSAQVQAQRSASEIGDWGYQAYTSADSAHGFAQAQYKSRWGLMTAGIDQNQGATTLRMEDQGALSWIDRGIFPSNTIYDSFAIVDTTRMARVHVLQENRNVGTTDASGRLLVPDMRAFDLNHLSIDPSDIPVDASVDTINQDVRPQDHSGVVVHFRVQESHGGLLRVVDEQGAPIEAGSEARLLETGTTVPVGFDGEAYLVNLNFLNHVEVTRVDGRHCFVSFNYLPISGVIPRIGPRLCRAGLP